jgi:hypothetical protein
MTMICKLCNTEIDRIITDVRRRKYSLCMDCLLICERYEYERERLLTLAKNSSKFVDFSI